MSVPYYLCARFGVVFELEVLPVGCGDVGDLPFDCEFVVAALPVFVFAGVVVFGAVVVVLAGVVVVAPGVVALDDGADAG